MNILVVSPVDLKNAAHNRLHELVGQLAKRHEVDVISTYAWWLRKEDGKGYNSRYYGGSLADMISAVRIQYISHSKLSPVLQEVLPIVTGKELIRNFGKSHYDLIFNYNTILSGLLFSFLLPETPMVLDLADDIASMAANSPTIPEMLRPIVGPFAQQCLRISVKRSRTVVLTTSALIDHYDIDRQKCIILPNGVDTGLFKKVDSRLAKSRFGLTDEFVVGYAGVLREWVDTHMLLEALDILRRSIYRCKLLVIGSEGGIAQFRREADRRKLSDLVILAGTLPYSDVHIAISAMDVGVIPFKLDNVTKNALPLKLFEYMSCETPVVSQRLGPVIDAVGDGILYASDSKELAEQILALIQSKELRSRLAFEGRMITESSWSWNVMGSQLESVIKMAVR